MPEPLTRGFMQIGLDQPVSSLSAAGLADGMLSAFVLTFIIVNFVGLPCR
jgi:tetrahydromethanopterin S-methyltransferase subunit F